MLYDLVVIGGGINGCGCAADAALRGLSVLLCEQDDLAAQTSSKSSKLIHGGIRYLEQYQFNLVRHALKEQHILMNIAPALIHPLPFVMPYVAGLRPAWLLRCGLFLYDHLSHSRLLPHSKSISRRNDADYFTELQTNISKGFLFYDAQTSDTRLTIAVALLAKTQGATILTQSKFLQATPENQQWKISLQPKDGPIIQIKAKALINAAGPWSTEVAGACQQPSHHQVSYVKGSHIVVPKFYDGDHAYLLQAPNKRIIFIIPYHAHLLVGTTDVLISKPSPNPSISPEETQYLTDIVRQYFQHSINTILDSWAGIRVLPAHPNQNPSELSRDFCFEYHAQPAPMVSILSGKLTTYRVLAEKVIDNFIQVFPNMGPCVTQVTPLPGSQWQKGSFSDYLRFAKTQYHWLDPAILNHYLGNYGSRTEILLENCNQESDLGLKFGPILRQREIDFLRQTEWAHSAEDILSRRTQLGLDISSHDQQNLEKYLLNCHI